MNGSLPWEALMERLRALSDPGRVRILIALSRVEELCLCQFTDWLQLTPATLSRHLAQLQHAGWLRSRKEGRWVFFRLAETEPELLKPILAALNPQWLAEQQAQIDAIYSGTDALCGRKTQAKDCC